jgi:hypothetical protein
MSWWRQLWMSKWRKLLSRMVKDRNPRNYSYADAVRVMHGLDFTLAPHGAGSHRCWRGTALSGAVVVIGLVDQGHGSLKPYLIRDMIRQLEANGMIPADLE